MFGKLIGKLTVTPLLYACGALLVVCIGLGVALALARADVQTAQAAQKVAEGQRDTAQAAAAALDAELDAVVATNGSKSTVIDQLVDQITAMVETAKGLAAARDAAIARADASDAKRAALQRQIDHQRSQTYANDADCRAWNARPVCPAVTDGVLDDWQRAQ
ncbi:MAG TPA: hypothetical protein VFE72_02820 [Lysobacter sp.]|nr:hypothetical protein [Lysobacter sp.]